MTRDERELMIDRLQREADEGRERIRQRQAEREANPFSVQETLLADARLTKDAADLRFTDPSEPEPSPPVSKTPAPGVVYRRFDGNASAAFAADDATDLFDGTPPPDDAEDEFAAAVERFAGVVERRLFELENENIELKGLLGDALAKFAKLEGKVDMLTALLGPKTKLWTPS